VVGEDVGWMGGWVGGCLRWMGGAWVVAASCTFTPFALIARHMHLTTPSPLPSDGQNGVNHSLARRCWAAGCRMQNAECWMQDAGCGVQDVRCRMENPENPEPRNPKRTTQIELICHNKFLINISCYMKWAAQPQGWGWV